MSLINDALQRAKQTQQIKPPPVPNLELRPRDPVRSRSSLPGWLLPAIAIAIFITGALLFAVLHRKSVIARSEPANSSAVAQKDSAPVTAVSKPSADLGTNMNSSGVVLPPEPPPIKLQAILFSPTRPSAIISGKTVFVGDDFREFHVIAIGPHSATLVSGTKTNVLALH